MSVSCMIGYLALATIWMFLVSKKPELSMCRIKGKEIAITGGLPLEGGREGGEHN